MRYPLLFAALAAVMAAPASAAVLISVDKSEQRMTVSVDGVPRYVWPVSTGKAGHATPSGTFKAFRMEADHLSKEWDDAPMPHSIFFTTEGHAIHGSFDTKRLGTAASHGCVRLAPENAAVLFALVKQDGLLTTKVVLTGNAPASAPLVAQRKPPRAAPQPEQTVGYSQDNNEVYYDPRTGTYARPYRAPAYAQQERVYAPRPQEPVYDRPTWGQQPSYNQGYGQPQYDQPRRSPFPFFN